jgi:hypothetical protein
MWENFVYVSNSIQNAFDWLPRFVFNFHVPSLWWEHEIDSNNRECWWRDLFRLLKYDRAPLYRIA